MKIKHLFVSILLATGFQPMIAQSCLLYTSDAADE